MRLRSAANLCDGFIQDGRLCLLTLLRELLQAVVAALPPRSLSALRAACTQLKNLAEEEQLWECHCRSNWGLGLGSTPLSEVDHAALAQLMAHSSWRRLFWQSAPLRPTERTPGVLAERSAWSAIPKNPMPPSLKQRVGSDWLFVEIFVQCVNDSEVPPNDSEVPDRPLARGFWPLDVDTAAQKWPGTAELGRLWETENWVTGESVVFKLDPPLSVEHDNNADDSEEVLGLRIIAQIGGTVLPLADTCHMFSDGRGGNEVSFTSARDVEVEVRFDPLVYGHGTFAPRDDGFRGCVVDTIHMAYGVHTEDEVITDAESRLRLSKMYGTGGDGFRCFLGDLRSAMGAALPNDRDDD